MVTFIIPGRLSSQNDVIRAAAYNRYGGGAKRKKEKEHCYWAILGQMNGTRFLAPVTLSIVWIEPNAKRDIDNIAAGGTKVLIDALVMAKVIPNDTREWVKGIAHSFPAPDKYYPRIEVTITEAA